MEKGFKKLSGMRVMLSLPKKEESPIKLTPELQEEMDREFALKCTSLEVYAVGDSVDGFEEGDKVYIPTDALRRGNLLLVNGEQKIIINPFDISLVW